MVAIEMSLITVTEVKPRKWIVQILSLEPWYQVFGELGDQLVVSIDRALWLDD